MSHSLISSITQASRAIQSSENTLLIAIQKIIGVTAPADPQFTHVLCAAARGGGTAATRHALAKRNTASCSERSRVTVEPSDRTNRHRICFNGGDSSAGQGQGLPPCSPIYHYPSSCVGILLATYMLRHYLALAREPEADNHFILQDASALLTWIDKLLEKCKDLSAAYALDILSVVATDIQQM